MKSRTVATKNINIHQKLINKTKLKKNCVEHSNISPSINLRTN